MEIMPATQEEIVEFKTAAAQRYAEKGVSPEVADKLFNAQMAKVAAEMNLRPVPNAKIEKLASALAQTLGVKRAQAAEPAAPSVKNPPLTPPSPVASFAAKPGTDTLDTVKRHFNDRKALASFAANPGKK